MKNQYYVPAHIWWNEATPQRSSFPYHWCTPGGKIEKDETPLRALNRELREELNLNILDASLAKLVFSIDLDPPVTERQLNVTCYQINWKNIIGELKPGDGIIGVGWFSAEELENLKMTPSDKFNIDKLIQLLKWLNLKKYIIG